MIKHVMRTVLIGAALWSVAGSVSARDARPNETQSQFCARMHAFCTRCDAGRARDVPKATCLATCASRLAACRSDGCYAYSDRPRCFK